MQKAASQSRGLRVVKRPDRIRLKALNEMGKSMKWRPRTLAVCIQHECDHLNGKLFVDYLSTLIWSRIKSLLSKQKRVEAIS